MVTNTLSMCGEDCSKQRRIASLRREVSNSWNREGSQGIQGSKGFKKEDASKQVRKIANLDVDAEVTLIDKTQERYDEEMLFDVQDDLQGEEVVTEKEVAEKEISVADLITTAGEVVTTVSATKTVDELTLAQTLIEIKAAKPRLFTKLLPQQITTASKDKGKAKMVEPENPLKKKDQIALDEELALRLQL
ncbi:hypothetical protein Tco_0218919 [Tanacetum coccineum]